MAGDEVNVWAVTMVRDEADVISDTILHMLEEGVDGIIVADNGSADGTRDILSDLADVYSDELLVVDDDELGYYQSKKMTALAAQAAERGAEWIIPFDADEVWYGNGAPVAKLLRDVGHTLRVVQVPLYNHYATSLDHSDLQRPFQKLTWRAVAPGALPKVCVRWRDDCTIMQGNHSAQFGHGIMPHESTAVGVEIRHFPYRSADQFVRKARNGYEAYQATNLPADTGAHWREYGRILELHGEDALRGVFWEHFYYSAPATAGLVEDPAPFRRWKDAPAEAPQEGGE